MTKPITASPLCAAASSAFFVSSRMIGRRESISIPPRTPVLATVAMN
ncbi:MAG: hypothetical protein QM820_16290 [Minicystis sp.]